MANTEKCAHPACSCPVKDGEKYCSPFAETPAILQTLPAVAGIWTVRGEPALSPGHLCGTCGVPDGRYRQNTTL